MSSASALCPPRLPELARREPNAASCRSPPRPPPALPWGAGVPVRVPTCSRRLAWPAARVPASCSISSLWSAALCRA